MADNFTVTAGSGITLASDDVGGVQYRRTKLSLGADGSATDAVGGAGAVSAAVMRVTLASDDPAVASLATVTAALFAEDTAHTTGDKGHQMLSRRIDAPATSADTTGDYATINTDANGKVWVTDPFTTITVTPTIDTAIFAAGDAVGGKQTLTSAVHGTSGIARLDGLTVIDKGNQKSVLDIVFFESDPTAATITNNAAFVFSTDISKVIGRVQVAAADYQTINGIAVAQVPLTTLPPVVLKANGSTSLFAAVILRSGTPTYVSAGDLIFKYSLAQK
jgi:hypothetical protein